MWESLQVRSSGGQRPPGGKELSVDRRPAGGLEHTAPGSVVSGEPGEAQHHCTAAGGFVGQLGKSGIKCQCDELEAL